MNVENCFKSTLTQVARSGTFQTVDVTAGCGKKRNYCPPSAKRIEVETTAILAGSNGKPSTPGQITNGAKESFFEDMGPEQDLTFNSYTDTEE
ncbi:MAG: hypothetical protein ACOYJF_01600 [Prevotella sp.]